MVYPLIVVFLDQNNSKTPRWNWKDLGAPTRGSGPPTRRSVASKRDFGAIVGAMQYIYIYVNVYNIYYMYIYIGFMNATI